MTLQHSCLLIIATEYAAIYFKNPDLCVLWRAHDSLGTDYDMESLLKKKCIYSPGFQVDNFLKFLSQIKVYKILFWKKKKKPRYCHIVLWHRARCACLRSRRSKGREAQVNRKDCLHEASLCSSEGGHSCISSESNAQLSTVGEGSSYVPLPCNQEKVPVSCSRTARVLHSCISYS